LGQILKRIKTLVVCDLLSNHWKKAEILSRKNYNQKRGPIRSWRMSTRIRPMRGEENMEKTALMMAASLLGLTALPVLAQTRTSLDIYVIDVEGGNSALFVPPSGWAIWPGTRNST
jgi:hypothetical protein